MVQKVNNCCCFTLPVGAQILGWLGVAGGVLDIFGAIGVLVSGGKKDTASVSQPRDFHELQMMLDSRQGRIVVEEDHSVATFIGSLVSCLVVIVVSALLIVGTIRKSHNMILPWLILQTIGLIGMIIGVLALLGFGIFFLCFGAQGSVPAVMMFAFALFVAAVAGLSYYFIIAMYSHYQNIRDESQRPFNRAGADAERLNPAPYGQSYPSYPANPNSYQVKPMYNNQS